MDLAQELSKWESKIQKLLEKFPERSPRFRTISGIELKRVYTPLDLGIQDDLYLEKLGFPGEYPFTRGIHATMYRGRIWTMRMYSGFGSAEDTNARYKYLISQGQTGLSVAFDLPTQLGLDSDDPRAMGEVGRAGVAISSLEDMNLLFDGIPLAEVSTSMTINAPAMIILCMYNAVAESQGASISDLAGTVQNDIFKEFIARGNYIYPPEPSLRLCVDLIEYCSKQMPRWNSISISGYHMREAGANAVQEIAFTLANAMGYVEACLERGLKLDEFAGRFSFFFGAHNNFFEEIAKFRAARRLWAQIMKQRYGAQDPRSMMLRFHVQTDGVTLTAQQPLLNIVRVAYQALAAVLGGAQSLHTNSYDEALWLPTEESVRIALRTQQILAYETGVADVVDPLGGSYYVEWLTDQIQERVQKYLDEIERNGSMLEGVIHGIETGYFQREIAKSSYEFQKQVESGEYIIVGVNKFRMDQEVDIKRFELDEAGIERQLRRLARVRSHRDQSKVQELLSKIARVAESDQNLTPVVYQAVKARATLGEICSTLKQVWGEHREKIVF